MPVESGPYCAYCVDESGALQAFAERFERMVQWVVGRDQSVSRAAAEAQTLDYMATMPAWRDHPELVARRG